MLTKTDGAIHQGMDFPLPSCSEVSDPVSTTAAMVYENSIGITAISSDIRDISMGKDTDVRTLGSLPAELLSQPRSVFRPPAGYTC